MNTTKTTRVPASQPAGLPRMPLLRSEHGFMLIELLAVAIMMIVVMMAIFGLYRVAIKQQQNVNSQSHGITAEKSGLERMSREIRQASTICSAYPTCGSSFTNSATIDIQTYTSGGTQTWVRYDCSGTTTQTVPPALTTRACLRSQSTTTSGLGTSAAVVVGDVAISPTGIFSFTTPAFVTIALQVVVKGLNKPIALQDGVNARNI